VEESILDYLNCNVGFKVQTTQFEKSDYICSNHSLLMSRSSIQYIIFYHFKPHLALRF
jgi:hypothetical protein